MSTTNYVIEELQRYKGYWQGVLDKKVHLDFKDGEIQVLIALPSGTVVFNKQSRSSAKIFDESIIVKKQRMWHKIMQIERWLENLSKREREAIFWRFIQHDFEPAPYYQQHNLVLKWRTLSWEEIAKKMGISKTGVYYLTQAGLEKIAQLEEALDITERK
jgi:DNA-directed RNA polymerase specialized sigma subunit